MKEAFPIHENELEGYRFVIKIPIQFRDIDGMGHMNNVAYFAFLETARLEYFIQLLQLQDRNKDITSMPFVLGGQNITYRTPAFFRETLLIGVRTNWARRSSFGFEFVMQDEASRRLVAEGSGTHVMFNAETGRSIPIIPEWLERLEAWEGRKLRNTE